jgi:uncharacterized protein DUF6689
MRILSSVTFVVMLGITSAAFAQTPIPLTIDGNRALGTIALQGGIEADLTISFETVTGLSPNALDATATVVDPADPSLSARLPGMVSALEAFPVLVRITPTNASSLAFRGVVKVELHTGNLHLDQSEPKSLFKAPDGGFFQDITANEASGSYRVCGSGGGFSEFLIVSDRQGMLQVQLLDAIIINKFVNLTATLTQHASSMPLLVHLTLQTRLVQARSLFDQGNLLGAITKITSFSDYARAHSGSDIPDLWQAGNPSLVNVAGLLRAGADTLRFSLQRASQ